MHDSLKRIANPLGRQTEYVSVYAPHLLFPIARQLAREQLALSATLPFYGIDIWTGYEVSWLDPQGKPQVAVAEFVVPCESECIVESKSFKLYLNSFNQTRFTDMAEVVATLKRDLSAIVGAEINVSLESTQAFAGRGLPKFDGQFIDDLSVTIEHYQPAPELLEVAGEYVDEVLCSDLLKTNCPVTGQPDWASLQIRYRGKRIVHESLLRYIVSFREHQDFHEHCVERMFMDIQSRCNPDYLSVYARYTRRGGLDINPFRSTDAQEQPPVVRLVRQ